MRTSVVAGVVMVDMVVMVTTTMVVIIMIVVIADDDRAGHQHGGLCGEESRNLQPAPLL